MNDATLIAVLLGIGSVVWLLWAIFARSEEKYMRRK